MRDKNIIHKIRVQWGIWQNHKRFYPDIKMWWERYVKKQLQRLLRQEERERTSNLRIMENHLYECLYDIICSDVPEADKFPALQRYRPRSWGYTQNGMREYYSTQLSTTAWRMRNHPFTTFSKCSGDGKPGRYNRLGLTRPQYHQAQGSKKCLCNSPATEI